MPIPTKKIKEKPKTAKERVYSEVRNWIIDGTLQPEEKISDQEISRYFSVSRTPVREAIQMLSDQHLVNIYPGKETLVAPINLKEAMSNFKIIADLHALAVEFAYPKITDDTIEELKKINASCIVSNNANDIVASEHFDDEFHQVFVNLADNHFLSEFIHILRSHIQRVKNIDYKENGEATFKSHDNIIIALENKDLEAAKDAMRANWLHAVDRMKNLKVE